MSKYNIESFYRAVLSSNSGLARAITGSTITVSKVPTLTSGFLTISPDTPNEEIVFYDGVDAVAKTITLTMRGINPASTSLTTPGVDYNNATFAFAHNPLAIISADINNLHINQHPDFTANPTITGNVTFSGKVVSSGEFKGPTFADTTARDAEYTAPVNGDECFVVGTGKQVYSGGTWITLGVGSAPANGSETVAGLWEGATTAEMGTATAVGGTGANLVVMNKNLKKVSAGASDENKIPVLDSTGKLNSFVNGSTLSGVQVPVTITGDASGTGTNGANIILGNTGVSAATYNRANITVDSKGRITAANDNIAQITASNNVKHSFANESGSGDIVGFKTVTINEPSIRVNPSSSFRIGITFAKTSGPGWVRLYVKDNFGNTLYDSGTVGGSVTTTFDVGFLAGRTSLTFDSQTNTGVEGWNFTGANIMYDVTTVAPFVINN